MVSMTLALMTVLPSRRAIVAGATALRAASTKSAPVLALPASPPAVIALPAPRGSSPVLAAIENHRSANLAVSQAVRDYLRAEDDSAPDEALTLAIADRASDEEVAALNALLALTPADAEEVRTLATYLAEVAQDFDKQAFGAWLFERFAVMIARAKAQA